MKHDIPENAKNSDVIYLINEYVRLERDRQILKAHWFKGETFEGIAERFDLSVNAVKNIIYNQGDKILLKIE